MIAIDGQDCVFLAMVMASDSTDQPLYIGRAESAAEQQPLLCEKFIQPIEDENGLLTDVRYKNEETYNFAFDTVDEIARREPDKLAMVHISDDMTERRFTFKDMKDASSQSAN